MGGETVVEGVQEPPLMLSRYYPPPLPPPSPPPHLRCLSLLDLGLADLLLPVLGLESLPATPASA